MAVRTDFTAGEVLAAQDLNDTFASKLPYSYGTATPSTSDDGFLWYDSNSTPPQPKFWDGAAFQAFTSGKILQVVRATDSTERTTSSLSYVDVTGMSVTITPSQTSSAIIIVATASLYVERAGSNTSITYGTFQIADSSNNAISGAENNDAGIRSNSTSVINRSYHPLALVGYATPATTSAVTYKLRFLSAQSSIVIRLQNDLTTGQMYAIEVAA